MLQGLASKTTTCTEERFLLIPGPADGVDLPLGSSDTEATGNQDPTGGQKSEVSGFGLEWLTHEQQQQQKNQ